MLTALLRFVESAATPHDAQEKRLLPRVSLILKYIGGLAVMLLQDDIDHEKQLQYGRSPRTIADKNMLDS